MKNMKKKAVCALTIALCLAGTQSMNVLASPSINDIQESEEASTVTDISTDVNTGEILSKEDVYTSLSVSDQYKVEDEDGNLVATPLSDTIDLGAKTETEVDENGHAIEEDIPTVKEIMNDFAKAAKVDLPTDKTVDLENLDQITYFLDLKYESTDFRVIAGVEVQEETRTVKLDDGTYEAKVAGGEIMRDADKDDFVIIQIDASTKEVHYVTIKEIDKDTGKYVVDFPCIGPYMITQKMK